jgi:hypothetical protein
MEARFEASTEGALREVGAVAIGPESPRRCEWFIWRANSHAKDPATTGIGRRSAGVIHGVRMIVKTWKNKRGRFESSQLSRH